MAITVAKIQSFTKLKTDNADKVGRNLGLEIHELTGDGSLTTVEVPTDLKVIKFIQVVYWDVSGIQAIQYGTDGIITSGALTVTWSTAITNAKVVRVMIWGYN